MKIDLRQMRLIDPSKIGAPYTKMLREADRFITEFPWCCGIKRGYFGLGTADVISVFLCEIDRANPKVDEWLWVIVGDIPPAYLVTDRTKNAEDALRIYIKEMKKWVVAVRKGRSVADLIPVNTPPEHEYAEMLHARLETLHDFFFKRDKEQK
jgi:hypothetical protein